MIAKRYRVQALPSGYGRRVPSYADAQRLAWDMVGSGHAHWAAVFAQLLDGRWLFVEKWRLGQEGGFEHVSPDEACCEVGWLHMNDDTEVQRCDDCAVFATEEDAAEAHAVDCECGLTLNTESRGESYDGGDNW